MTHRAPRRGKIVVTGMGCYLPTAGVIYQILHYLIGLRRLGYDPYYVEESSRWIYDFTIQAISPDASRNVTRIAALLDAHGLSGRWAFRGDYEGGQCYGMAESEIRRLYREADALLNVTGAQVMGEQHLACRRRLYIESDPFATQVRVAHGDQAEIARLAAHDMHFSFGENIGAPDCTVPTDGFHWLPTRQPVAIELWDAPSCSTPRALRPGAYTTITTWRNAIEGVVYQGQMYYWQKHREFEKFLDLPRRAAVAFELASGVGEDVRRTLCAHGWRYVPMDGGEDVDRYRDYIRCSRAEFTVARDQYVRPRTGWFSDRSACYLAAGRPVITQDTAFGKFVPTGRGLFAFTTMDDILAAVDAIESDYDAHSRAAREVAVEYFAAEKVVGRLLEWAGV